MRLASYLERPGSSFLATSLRREPHKAWALSPGRFDLLAADPLPLVALELLEQCCGFGRAHWRLASGTLLRPRCPSSSVAVVASSARTPDSRLRRLCGHRGRGGPSKDAGVRGQPAPEHGMDRIMDSSYVEHDELGTCSVRANRLQPVPPFAATLLLRRRTLILRAERRVRRRSCVVCNREKPLQLGFRAASPHLPDTFVL